MKITALAAQIRNQNRVNVSVDGRYVLSLDVAQVIDFGLKIGLEIDESELDDLRKESEFGKLYSRSLEYSLIRPRSIKELRDYLYRKTLNTRTKTGSIRAGYSESVASRVMEALTNKGYVDDEKFAHYWVENRNLRKGSSARKLRSELYTKGIAQSIVDEVLQSTDRLDEVELRKVIARKSSKYDDPNKLKAYLLRQGFSYDDVKRALDE
jgi:regulatory protein